MPIPVTYSTDRPSPIIYQAPPQQDRFAGLGQIAEMFLNLAKQREQQKNYESELRKWGVIKEPPTPREQYREAGRLGGLNMIGGLSPTSPRYTPELEQKMMQQALQRQGIPIPEIQTEPIYDIQRAAELGMTLQPPSVGGMLEFKPKVGMGETPIFSYTQGGGLQQIGMAPKGAKVIQNKLGEDLGGEGLDAKDKIAGYDLARKIGGVRGAAKIAPIIYERMRSGQSIDKIEDELRYAKQSQEFEPYRNAAQSLLVDKSDFIAQKAMDSLDDYVSKGDTAGAQNMLKRIARKSAGVEQEKAVMGTERTISLLDQIKDDLTRYQQGGGDTNIFTGTAEQVNKKIGRTLNPELAKIATKIQAAIQKYRLDMSGKAFSVPENIEYKSMFPSIKNTQGLNVANIDALLDVMRLDQDNFYAMTMGEDNYRNIFGQPQKTQAGGFEIVSEEPVR